MDRRFRVQHWRRARHSYQDLCPSVGRRAATALLWLSCSIALLRALAGSSGRAQRAAAQPRRNFLNAHHRSATQPFPGPSDSDSEHEDTDRDLSSPECPDSSESDVQSDFDNDFDYDFESETESDLDFDTDTYTDTETAPTTEPETEPEDELGPVVTRLPASRQSLTERLYALRLQSPDASPVRTQPSTQEPRSPGQEELPQPAEKTPGDPEEPAEPAEQRQQSPCKPKKPTRRNPSPESPSKRGPIPIRRY